MTRLGSLFDGSGGFPLAGALYGITPVWASEIEPFPLRVTAARFPRMEQLGDVTKINGAAIEPVEIITFGSPCQDLSIAGKQAGLEGQRSSLFFEAIRIIREMRSATHGQYPRFAVWENVPGAFSSHKGADFRAVLQALCEIVGGEGLSVPLPTKSKWQNAGCIVGDGFSLAWRVYEAQYWGVPQRRKRIYLVADFGSERAGEILFERESVSGHLEPGEQAREGTAADAERSAGRSYLSFPWNNSTNAGLSVDEVSPTVKATRCGEPAVVYAIGAYNSNAWKSDNPHSGVYEADKTRTLDLNGGNPTCQQGGTVIVENVWPDVARGLCARADSSPCIDRGQNVVVYSSSSHGTLSEGVGTGTRAVHEMVAVFDARGNGEGDVCPTIAGDHENRVTDYTALAVARCQSMSEYAIDGTTSTIKARDFKGGAVDVVVEKRPQRKYIVRRLMPIECCRLQGFPDWWDMDVQGSDSARYKMWGNGLALPCAADVLGRIARVMSG